MNTKELETKIEDLSNLVEVLVKKIAILKKDQEEMKDKIEMFEIAFSIDYKKNKKDEKCENPGCKRKRLEDEKYCKQCKQIFENAFREGHGHAQALNANMNG